MTLFKNAKIFEEAYQNTGVALHAINGCVKTDTCFYNPDVFTEAVIASETSQMVFNKYLGASQI